MDKPHAIVIGAGFTGVATAHDLALRGFDVTVVERGPIVNGTSGRTHGLLHSGGRYAVKDQESAIECIDENMILRKIVPEVIEPNGGLFIALDDSDMAYVEDFIVGCEQCHIPIEELKPKQALAMEPNLNPNLLLAYTVPDGTFDPLRLGMAFAATAKSNGARFHLYTEVEDFVQDGKGNVMGVKVWDRTDDRHFEVRGDIVINCTGAWAGEVAGMAGADVPVTPTPGIMIAYNQRVTERAINRLNRPGDGDILLPQRRMAVIGTTSYTVDNLDYVPVIEEQIKQMYDCAVELVPQISKTQVRGIYTATRPLVGAGDSGRSIARTFKAFDHKETHGIDGLVTITGGKATTLRQMAEKVVDLVCQKMGVQAECTTADTPLLSYREYYRFEN